MKVITVGDTAWEARLDRVLNTLADLERQSYFEERNYGDGLNKVLIGLICQDPELNLKRRVRLTKKDKTLSMDIMLDLPEMIGLPDDARKRNVAERLLKEVPEVVLKYKIADFDSARFINDFKSWIAKTGWIAQASQ